MERRLAITIIRASGLALCFGLAIPLPAASQEQWVSAIRSSTQWASFPCKNYLITSVCSTEKDYKDPGYLPDIISIGDTVSFRARDGSRKQFVVRHISVFVFDEDVDFTSGGQRLTARRGDTTCSLYDVVARADTKDSAYPSKIVVKQCRALR